MTDIGYWPHYDNMIPDYKFKDIGGKLTVCCVCGNGHKTLLKRNGKMICRDCYAAYLRDVEMKNNKRND